MMAVSYTHLDVYKRQEKNVMKNLIIIAAGGMGRTLYDMARESLGFATEFVLSLIHILLILSEVKSMYRNVLQ